MKTITINIYGWKDFTQWFWNKFCFPRRKLIADWIEYHNDRCLSKFEYVILDATGWNLDKAEELAKFQELHSRMREVFENQSEETKEIILASK